MASKMRVEFVRLRQRDSNGLQALDSISDAVPVTKAVTGAALTGAGRVTVPAKVGGFTRFHARITSDVELIVTVAPAGDVTTTYDASAVAPGGITIPAGRSELIPVTPGQLISAATGLSFA